MHLNHSTRHGKAKAKREENVVRLSLKCTDWCVGQVAAHVPCHAHRLSEKNHIKLSYFSPNLTIPSSLCLAVLHRIKMISHIYECVPTLSTVGNFNESDDHIWTFLLSGSWFVGCTQIWDVGADERCCDIGQSKERERERQRASRSISNVFILDCVVEEENLFPMRMYSRVRNRREY